MQAIGRISDLSGVEIPEGDGAVVVIYSSDGTPPRLLDLTCDEARELSRRGRPVAEAISQEIYEWLRDEDEDNDLMYEWLRDADDESEKTD